MRIFRTLDSLQKSLVKVALLAVAVCVAPSAVAQATRAPTPAQLDTFRNLPPDQQQAVLEAIGGQGADSVARRDPQLAVPQTPPPRFQPVEPPEPIGPPRIAAGSTLVLDVTVRKTEETSQLAERQQLLISERRDRIASGNPYRVDGQGNLLLPSFPPIALAGLTDAQAAQRLNFDPRLTGLHFAVNLLPVEPAGTESLKPFGYDIFEETPTTFAPVSDIPVPADYQMGPGDNVTVELFGKKTGRYQLVVDRSGALTLPEFGPIQVVGLTFDRMRSEIERRVSEQMIGVRASITMGQLRSIRIFVVGDVKRPGSYTVSALSTITNALFASGGVSEIGSLRNIELKRGAATVTRLDLYDLLLRGDTSRDLQLQQGDAIFVPAIGSTASVTGEIRRPAIYEFRDGTTAGELVDLSGGLSPNADARTVRLERVNADRQRVVLDLDLTAAVGRNQRLLSGDVLTIPRVLDDTRGVLLEGHIHRSGAHAWREGMRLTDLLGSLAIFQTNADQRYVLIRREHLPNRRIELLSADAVAAFGSPRSVADPPLASGDRIIVFSRLPDRGDALARVLEEMRLQTRDNEPQPVVFISGRVRAPGAYPLESNMTVADLIRAGGGLDDAAYPLTAELTRYSTVNNEVRRTEVINLDLANVAAGASSSQAGLQPYDVLLVKETPEWRGQESITLTGEVRFPGLYPIRKGETLSSVVARAGGLTDAAFPKGSVFMREELKEQERRQLDTLATRLQSDLALVALRNAQIESEDAGETLTAGQSLLTQLRTAVPTGRLVVDLERALARKGDENDIELRGGDQLLVPRLRQYVTVLGEVQNATSHVWKSELDSDDYIQLSGGPTQKADAARTYVVRADGSVLAPQGPFWFRRQPRSTLEPGDTVVVPIDAERTPALPLWTAVATIVGNLAVAFAAANSF